MFEDNVKAISELLKEHRGGDVVILDVRRMIDWTDYFIVATGTSSAHLDGLERGIKEFCGEKKIDILRKSRRTDAEDEWRLIDLGEAVIHLFSKQARDFYELERLWASQSSKSS
jgi:ribosome-associated protein